MTTWRRMYGFPLYDEYDHPMERLRLDGHAIRLLQMRFRARIVHAGESRFRFWPDRPMIVGLLLLYGDGNPPEPQVLGSYLEQTIGVPIIGQFAVIWDVDAAKANSLNPRQPASEMTIIPCYGPRKLLSTGQHDSLNG